MGIEWRDYVGAMSRPLSAVDIRDGKIEPRWNRGVNLRSRYNLGCIRDSMFKILPWEPVERRDGERQQYVALAAMRIDYQRKKRDPGTGVEKKGYATAAVNDCVDAAQASRPLAPWPTVRICRIADVLCDMHLEWEKRVTGRILNSRHR